MNNLKTVAFATLIAVGSTLATAQESTGPAMQSTTQPAEHDDGVDLGWIGLLGLAGLLGMKRKDREPVVRTATRPL